MDKTLLVLLATATVFGTAFAACDNTTASKIGECVFKSDLLAPSKFPKSDNEVTTYCNANLTNKCLMTTMAECNDDDRQLSLMKSLTTQERVMEGQMYLCTNTTVLEKSYDCLQDLAKKEIQDCLNTAVGMRTNADEKDLKAKLDGMCNFFKAYAMCFDNEAINANCREIVKTAVKASVNGLKYAYCDMSASEKNSVVYAYTVGSASVVTGSLITVLSAYLISSIY